MDTQIIDKTNMSLDFRSRSKHIPKPEDKSFGQARHATDEKAFDLAEKRLEKEFDEIWASL